MHPPLTPLVASWSARDADELSDSWHVYVGHEFFKRDSIVFGRWSMATDSFLGEGEIAGDIFEQIRCDIVAIDGPEPATLAEEILSRLYADTDDAPPDEMDASFRAALVRWVATNRISSGVAETTKRSPRPYLFLNGLFETLPLNRKDLDEGAWYLLANNALAEDALEIGRSTSRHGTFETIGRVAGADWSVMWPRITDFDDDDAPGLADELLGLLTARSTVPNDARTLFRSALVEWIDTNRARAFASANRVLAGAQV